MSVISTFIDILKDIFYTLFQKVFTPIISDILHMYAQYIIMVLWSIWSEILLVLLTVLCSLVDFIEHIFNVFAGISPVEVNKQSTYLLDAFFQMKEVTTAFASVTVMAVIICFIFTIYKTAKSISDMALEDKNPISKVLGDGMKAAVTFMLIPFLCISLLQISSIVTNQVINTFDSVQGGNTSIGTIIFLSSGLDADKMTTKRRDIISGQIENEQSGRNPSFTDSVRRPYLEGKKDYRDLTVVKKDFYAANFNYVAGFASAVILLFILSGATMIFIRRLFELLLLYLVSPFFVSTIPLDDGITFAKWREMFVAKFFSGFGVIFSMRYYLMLVPSIAGNDLCLYDMSLPNAVVINSILKMFLIIGGAWAVYKSQHLILQIFNPEAASADEQAGNLIKGIVVGTATTAGSMAMAAATGGGSAAMNALGGAGGTMGKLSSAMDEMGSSGGDERQKYTGK